MIKRIIMLAVLLTGITAAGSPAYATGAKHPLKCSAYQTAQGVSLCAAFPGSEDRDCGDVGTGVVLVGKWDPWQLDVDHDGIGRELAESPALSGSASPSASASTSTSASASASPSASATKSPSRTPSEPATTTPDSTPGAAGPSLPLTGPSLWALLPAGIAALGLGGVLFVAARRRRNRFEA